jgi:putative component of membrane protein insertase Oxa1/YidC/SpoIIIJ protein YidD
MINYPAFSWTISPVIGNLGTLVPACSIYAADQGLERSGGSLPAYCLSNTTTL